MKMVICKQEKRRENVIKFENAKRCDDECGSCAKDISDDNGCENRKRQGAGNNAGGGGKSEKKRGYQRRLIAASGGI